MHVTAYNEKLKRFLWQLLNNNGLIEGHIAECLPGIPYRSHAEVVWVAITLALFYMFFINVYLEG